MLFPLPWSFFKIKKKNVFWVPGILGTQDKLIGGHWEMEREGSVSSISQMAVWDGDKCWILYLYSFIRICSFVANSGPS